MYTPYLLEDPSFYQIFSLLTTLLRGGRYGDRSAIEGGRYACGRGCSKGSNNKVIDRVPDIDVRGLCSDKAYQWTIILIAIATVFEKTEKSN